MGKNKNSAKPTYWHGGSAGLAVGDRLLPLAQVPSQQGLLGLRPLRHADVYDPRYLYVTTDRDLALDFAIDLVKFIGKPAALYQVRTLGSRVHDIDYPRGISFGCAEGAIVTGVTPVAASMAKTGAARGYKTWSDDCPMYDAQGYALPNKLQSRLGITATDLRQLGIGPGYEEIVMLAHTLVQQRHPGLKETDIRRIEKTL